MKDGTEKTSKPDSEMIKKTITALAMTGACLLAATANANTISFETPISSTTSGGAVDAKAIFTTGANTLSITLMNLESNPKDVAECISALGFAITTGQTAGSLTSSSGKERSVAKTGGGFTDGSTVSTGWGMLTSGGGFELDALGFIGPAHLVIGGPDAGNKYSNAKGSIAGNKPHNPFLAGNVTFSLHINGLTENSSIKNVFFQFGTTDGSDIIRIPTNPPKVADGGMTVALLGFALSGFVLIRRKLGPA